MSIYLLSINIIGFITCCMDKYFAIKNMYRISEKILIMICIIGGVFGFLFGMNMSNHKTKKNKFKKYVYVSLILWILIGGLYGCRN